MRSPTFEWYLVEATRIALNAHLADVVTVRDNVTMTIQTLTSKETGEPFHGWGSVILDFPHTLIDSGLGPAQISSEILNELLMASNPFAVGM